MLNICDIPQNIHQEPTNAWLCVFQHDGIERKHLWQVESVEVTNLSTETSWIFRCGQVLSLWKPGIGLKVILNAELKEIVEKGIKISTFSFLMNIEIISLFHFRT